MSRAVAFTWGLGVVLVVASPIFRDPLNDDYPLSTFPMFAEPLESPSFYSAEGVRTDKSRVMVAPEIIANGAAMQAVQTMQAAHAQGRKALQKLCERVAARAPHEAALRDVARVELVSARYDPVAYFTSSREPLERKVLHKCRVP